MTALFALITLTTKKNGCFNLPPMAAGYWAHDGYIDAQRTQRRPVWIPHRMTTDCQYRKTQEGIDDPKCEGCLHREGAL